MTTRGVGMARVRAVLFDVDGTLLDSNDAQAHAWLDTLRGHGIDVPFDQVRSRVGMSSERLLRELAHVEADSLEGRELIERRSAVFKAHYLPDLGPLPGARVLVDRIRSRGVRCVAVTATPRADVADLLRASAVADLFELVVTEEDGQGTHEAELIEIALERLDLGAREAVLVGDTPWDVALARRVRMEIIGLRSGGWKDEALAGAVAVYEGPAQLASRLDDSVITRGVEDEDDASSFGSRRSGRASMRGI